MSDTEPDAVITLREPREAWLAPLFWGAFFCGLLLVPALLSDDVDSWERTASLVAGALGVPFFAGMSLQNLRRRVRCDATTLTFDQPFFAQRVLLRDVHAVVRRDIRKALRELRQRGMSKLPPKPMDTMAEVVVYSLRDRAGGQLCTLGRDLTPRPEMRRLLARLEQCMGHGIEDE